MQSTPYFTPADIEAVCAQAAQAAFEEEVATGVDRRVSTQDLLRAIQGHRATLSADGLAEFPARHPGLLPGRLLPSAPGRGVR